MTALAANAAKLLAALWIFWVAAGLGGALRRALKVEDPDSIATDAALGLGGLAVLLLALGAAGFFNARAFIALLLVLTVPAARKPNLEFLRSRSAQAWSRLRRLPAWAQALTLGAMAVLLMKAYVPDQFYDSLQYHLALPQSYLVEGRIAAVPYNAYSGFPQTMEMLYGLGLALGGDDALPLLIQLGSALLLAALLFSRFADPMQGWLAAALWMSCPIALEQVNFAKPDVFFCLCVTAAFYAARGQGGKAAGPDAKLAGLFAGLAAAVKLSGAFFALAFAAILAARCRRRPSLDLVKTLAVFSAMALAVFLPWAAKNVAFFNNPLYPLLQGAFGYVHSLPQSMPLWIPSELWPALRRLLALPFRLTFSGHEYPSMNYVGPVWLAFLPLAIGAPSREKPAAPAFVAGFFALNAFLYPDWARYFFFPATPVFAVWIVRSLDAWTGNAATFPRLLLLGIALHAFGWLPTLERAAYGRTALAGLSERRAEKLYSQGYYASALWTNRNLPAASKILFLGETRSHLFRRALIAPSINNEHWISEKLRGSADGGGIYAACRAEGITHLLYNRDEFVRLRGYPMFSWKPAHKRTLREFWSRHLRPVFAAGPITVYEISPGGDGSEPLPMEVEREIDASE